MFEESDVRALLSSPQKPRERDRQFLEVATNEISRLVGHRTPHVNSRTFLVETIFKSICNLLCLLIRLDR